MNLFISDFLRKEKEIDGEMYIYSVFSDLTYSSQKVFDFNWKRKTRMEMKRNEVIAVVIVYRVSENIVSFRCISKNKLPLKIIEVAIKLNNIDLIIGDKKNEIRRFRS